ncbi:MAG: hypothetical protein HOE30_04240 [Deltaproteobacteria bacterium]|jgi:hypothetical protein|nr:hypothetical protein [Deltaproteobacteria bacterium]MBT6614172.1 hypothetical protein [Deltaproteobacteria bacterium]
MKKLIFILLVLAFFGCKGDDGADGELHSLISWTTDITAIDLNSVLYTPYSVTTWELNKQYRFQPEKVGRIYWVSSGTTWYLDVITGAVATGGSGASEYIFLPKDGDDGKNTVYYTKFSGSTATSVFLRYENIVVIAGTDPVAFEISDEEKENAIEAEIDSENPPLIFK